MYEYRIKQVTRVIDGDTFECEVDLGFHISHWIRVRLMGIDCPEKTGSTRDRGFAAALFTCSWLDSHAGNLYITTMKTDSFGRWLSYVYTGKASPDSEMNIALTSYLDTALREAGHEVRH